MRGQIEIETCDLSPAGAHFLYTAEKANAAKEISTWTVVSRTPYLKAIAYYPRRRAGGWFLNSCDYCVPSGAGDPDDRESEDVRRVEMDCPDSSFYESRLVRSGWVLEGVQTKSGARIQFVRCAGSGWHLRHDPGGGYQLSCGDLSVDTDGWDWADMDNSRLVWAAEGCLWTGVASEDVIEKKRMLRDFNGLQFEQLAAPY